MPLPDNNVAWPPPALRPLLDTMEEHDAWYQGDTGRLAAVYGHPSKVNRTRPSQHAGGVAGAVARLFWGRPIPDGQSRARLHIPLAADIASTSADLLFSEPPRLILPKGTAAANSGVVTPTKSQDRLDLIFNDPATQAELLEAAELSSALSGTFLRMVWDKDLADHVLVDAVAADSAIPTWRFGMLSEVTFWSKVRTAGNLVWRHLEHHAPGSIEHGLYQGTQQNLGHRVPFQDDPSTEWLANPASGASPEGVIPTGVTGLTAAFIANVRPNRKARHNPFLAPYGRSDFDTIEPLFDAVDETWSSLMRDIRLAKARLIVPSAYVNSAGYGEGGSFDTDQELFTTLEMLGSSANQAPISAQQFDIRVQEHQDVIKDLTRTALRSAGYSAATFGDDSINIAKTATEVKANERLSERTRDKKARYWRAALPTFTRTLLQLDDLVFGTGASTEDLAEVRFSEKTQQDIEELARTSQLLRDARAASTVVLVRMNHPDWDSDMVDAEVKRIQQEDKYQAAADPFSLRPGIDDEGDEDDEVEAEGEV